MNRFFVFVLGAFVALGSCYTFGYFENKVYCDIDGDNVTIFMKYYPGKLKCKTYIDTIHQVALKKYNEIMDINSYIAQGEDVYYWKTVLEEKKSEFIHLINYKSQIISVVSRFESILFDRYYSLLQKQASDYYNDLELQYYDLINQSSQVKSPDGTLKIVYIEQQMGNVSRLLEAESLDDIMEIVPSYIYLKNQIGGSYE